MKKLFTLRLNQAQLDLLEDSLSNYVTDSLFHNEMAKLRDDYSLDDETATIVNGLGDIFDKINKTKKRERSCFVGVVGF